MQKKRPYIDINVPRDWESYLDEALKKVEIQKKLEIDRFSPTRSGLGTWIISEFLIEHTNFRFKHINTLEKHVTIYDKKMHRYIDIYPKEPNQLWCELCDSIDCEHVKFAFTVPEAREGLRKKGWKLPDVE